MPVSQTRPRDAAATRKAFIVAARERFARHSYDEVGLRDLARDVGVDASLVSRYFGSKEDLFAAVLDSCESDGSLFEGPRETFGRRIAEQFVFQPKEDGKLLGMRIILHSIGSARASEIVQASAEANFFGPFAEWIGGADAKVRVRIVGALLMGLSISRELGASFGFDSKESERLRDRLAAAIQALVDDTQA